MISKDEIMRIINVQDECVSLDYKEDLKLDKDGDKAEFVKDVISLANSTTISHIIIGVEDTTRKLVGLKTPHTIQQLNDIIKNRIDPPISLDYIEENIYGHTVGVVEIPGENPPYIVSVIDRFGGERTLGEPCYIKRGSLLIRNNNKNEGAVRANIDKMYENRVKYVTFQAELRLKAEILKITPDAETMNVNIQFRLENVGESLATGIYVWLQFQNVLQIVNLKSWQDISNINDNKPTIQQQFLYSVIKPILMKCGQLELKVNPDTKQIVALLRMGAVNMKTKNEPYVISLVKA